MKSYLFVFNGDQAIRQSVTARLDSIEAITNWVAFFDNTLCIISELNATELSEQIRAAIPNVQFIVTTLDKGKRNGWLPKSVWNFVNRSASADAEAAE